MLRRLLFAGLAAALLASCSGGDDKGSSPTTVPFVFDASTTTIPTTPVVAKVLSPEPASIQGAGGKGMVIALKFSAKDPTVLPAEFRLGGALPPPAPAAKPGHNPAFPGLVIGLSSTGSALGGPSVNLANLFQVVSPSLQLDGSREVSALWTNATVDFGTDIDTTLTAYVVAGTAPDTIPPTQANIDVLSNTVEVTFHLGGAGTGVASPTVDASSTTSSTARGATTTTARGTTTTTRPTSTTAAPTTTTTRATTTTVRSTTTTTCPLLVIC